MMSNNYVLLPKEKEDTSSVEVEKENEKSKPAPAADQTQSTEQSDAVENDHLLSNEPQMTWIMDSTLPGKHQGQKTQLSCEQVVDAEQIPTTIGARRKCLPVYAYRDEFLAAFEQFQILIFISDTGSGKSTQLPQYLHEAGYTQKDMKIGITQPSRIAAISIAQRVSEEMGHRLGEEVGYATQFEECTSEETLIKYMTDEYLLRELMTSPSLDEYTVIMIDEAHQRTVYTEILLALLKDLAKTRPIKLLIASGAMDIQSFSAYWDDAPIFLVPGCCQFPVEIYTMPQSGEDHVATAISTLFQIHTSQSRGDVLIFLPGLDEIESAETQITEIASNLGSQSELLVCPLYVNLPVNLQRKIFEPTPAEIRKVVLATNIAETSLPIDGIVYVIDAGFVKENRYDPATGMSKVVTIPCSRASALERSRRAGGAAPGKCFRLYTQWSQMNERDETTPPEIQQTNFIRGALLLKSLGIHDLSSFDFMSSPPPEVLNGALDQLYALSALTAQGELTNLGRQMMEFPTEPQVAKAIITSSQLGCSEEILSIMAILSESSTLFRQPKEEQKVQADRARASFMFEAGGDHLTYLNIWNQWGDSNFSAMWPVDNFLHLGSLNRARNLREQLAKACERIGVHLASNRSLDPVPMLKAITSGFFANAARLQHGGDGYQSIKQSAPVFIHPSSVLMGADAAVDFVIFHNLQVTGDYMQSCIPIQINWLHELAPKYYKQEDDEENPLSKNQRQM